MRRLLITCLLSLAAFAQDPSAIGGSQGAQQVFNGFLYANAFGTWSVPQGDVGQFTWSNPHVCENPTGVTFNLFSVGLPIKIIDADVTKNETTTITAVVKTGFQCSIVTAPLTFPHFSFRIVSGTFGLQEAVNYAIQRNLNTTVFLTNAWTMMGGTTGMITSAAGNANIGIADERSPLHKAYAWNGSAYIQQGLGGFGITNIDGVPIGQSVAAAGSFTTLNANGAESHSGSESHSGPETLTNTLTGSGDNPLVWGGSASFKRVLGCSAVYAGGPFANIAAAITDASTTGCVLIQPSYAGTDAYTTNPNNAFILNLRTPGLQPLGAFPSFVDVNKRSLRSRLDMIDGRPSGLWLSQGSAPAMVQGNANLTLGAVYNLGRNTENLAAVGFGAVAGGVLTPSDNISWNGITLGRVTGATFYDGMIQNLAGSGISLNPGTMYLFSEYAESNQPLEELLPQLGPGVINGVGVWASHLVDKNVRRLWFACVAVTSTTIDCGTQTPTTALGSGSAGGTVIWLNPGSLISNEMAADFPGITPTMDVYVGGFQIEAITTEKQGIAVIGDSKTQFSCGGTSGSAGSWDSSQCDSWPRWASSLLQVPFFNRAVGGQTCNDMDGRWATDITPLNVRAKYVIVNCGGNDIVQGRTLVQIQTNINSMASKAATDGLIFVLTTYEPTVSIGSNSTFEGIRQSLNNWIKQTFPRVLDFASVVEDPYDQTSIKRVFQWYPADGTHELWRARRAVGEYTALSYVGNPYGAPQIFDFQRPRPYQPVPTSTPTVGGVITGTSVKLIGATSATATLNAPATGGVTNTLPQTAGTLPVVISSGTATMTTALIAAGACGSFVTVGATGVTTTDAIAWTFNTAQGSNNGVLNVITNPSAGFVNFAYCNPTAAGVTPVAATLNWRVTR